MFVTNIVAFALGATTVIPALRSFCLFCSVGILAIFIYTLTFFTACMVLDQRRIDERRDGCLVKWPSYDLIKMSSYLPSGVSHPWGGLESKQAQQHEPCQPVLCKVGRLHVTEYGENFF